MPRIFHLIKSLGRGGAETLLAEGLRFSDRAKFEHRYGYFLPWKSEMANQLRTQEVDVVCFNRSSAFSILASSGVIAAALREWNADLLHCHLPLAAIPGRIAGRRVGIPVVYTEHNKLQRYHLLTRRASLLTWRWQDRVIAVSQEVAASIAQYRHADVPVEVVANGIDVDWYDPLKTSTADLREALGIPSSCLVIGTVAVFRKQKGLQYWLDAARQVRESRPDVRFLLVGDGPLDKELREIAKSLGIAQAVHFVGLQRDVRPYLALMDVFLVSSFFEGLPLALLEAMAMEKPVVATAVGGIPEVIDDGRNGLLVAAGDSGALALAVKRLLGNLELRHAMGRAARETVRKNFSMARMAGELEEIYLKLLDGHLDAG